MKDSINLAVIGVGCRGTQHIKECFAYMDDVNLVGVCDVYADRVKDVADFIEEKKGKRPEIETLDYHELLIADIVDAVLVATSWETHITIAIDAMRAGKVTAMEVGCAYSEGDCHRLIRAYEETETPFMFMENCCYDRRETMLFKMVREGLFGDIIHCEGGYCHDLREEVAKGKENRHYRLKNYLSHCCENYPTHEIGPLARILNINHGNRMVSLTSVASRPAGIADYAMRKLGKELDIMQGDVITTVIKCAKGQTITLTHSTSLPRPYSRRLAICGTRGMYNEDGDYVYIDEKDNEAEWEQKKVWNNAKDYEEKYLDNTWREFEKQKIDGGHGGMDYIMWRDFIDCFKNGKKMPIDVYDAATWLSISYLSEASIMQGGAPVYMPDFTNGRWVSDTEI